MICPGVPSLTTGTNEDVKDQRGYLVEKADIDWETSLSLALSPLEASLPSHYGKEKTLIIVF